MTLILGFNFGDAVVLTADSRLTMINRISGARSYHDATEKIFMTGLGPVAAAGDFTLIERATEAIDAERPPDSDQLRELFRREIAAHPFPHDPVVQSTGWLMAYHAGEGEEARVGLVLHPPYNGHRPVDIPVGSFSMIPANGMPQDLIDRLNAIIERALGRLAPGLTIQERVQIVMMITQETLRVAAGITDTVNTRFQVGLRTTDSVGISHFVEQFTDDLEWHGDPA